MKNNEVEFVSPSTIMVDERITSVLKPLPDESYQRLKLSIKENGIEQAIMVSAGMLVDGRHRLKAASELKLEQVPVVRIPFTSIEELQRKAVSIQLDRRNITAEERNLLILKHYEDVKSERGESRGRPKLASSDANFVEPDNTDVSAKIVFKGKTSEEVAKRVSEDLGQEVSQATVERVIAKDKPKKKKEFKEKDTIKICIIFTRNSSNEWEAFRTLFHSKKEAEEFMQEYYDDGNDMFDGAKTHTTVVDFFDKFDQQTLLGYTQEVEDGDQE